MAESDDVNDETNKFHKTQMSPSQKPRKPISRPILILIIFMAALLIVAIVTVVLYFSLTSASRHLSALVPNAPDISQLCNSTRSPDNCQSALKNFLPDLKNLTLLDVVQGSIKISSNNLNNATSLVEGLLQSPNQNLTNLAKVCVEVLKNGQSRISSTLDALPRGKLKDARAWMSAALGYQVGCASGLKNIYNQTQWPGGNDTLAFFDKLISLSSNALSMIVSYDVYGNDTASWKPPQTERNEFWEKAEAGGSDPFKGGFPSGLKASVTVCGGGCDYKKVQEAVDAAPGNLTGNDRFVIYIKEGVYDEIVRVAFEKKNLVFLGDGMGKTVITGSLNVGLLGVSTHNSATVGVMGDGFMASGLTIQNTAGIGAQQAVAFRSDSDQSIVENVEFLGNQDTLCPNSLRQFYRSCVIQGNIDFIFGSSAAFFQNCTILIRPRQLTPEKGETNAVTAHGRTDPAQSTGFVFQNCLINGTEAYMELYKNNSAVHKNYLGRPWKEYSRTVFVNCNLEALIDPQGWMPWSGDFALPTLYYGEFENSGPGSDVSKRVNWSSQVPSQHVNIYSVENFIQGNLWIPTS